ncbi:MAG: type II toxin-antitoxin system RelE/ParE family toxin [Acidobacteria bacterium]|nr:type II toxin-antitoxin system RelE/ParE family toxin [Acidobacteriota bacterium]
MPTCRIEVLRSAVKELRSLPKDAQIRIGRAIDSLASNPRPPRVKALQSDGKRLRIRIGDYRVIYQVEDDRLVVLIVKIGHRREIYK